MRQLRPAPRQTKPEPCLPVCSSSALLAESETKPVVSKHQDPLFLCGLCPVPAPAGSAVDLWQPGKTDSHHPASRRTEQHGKFLVCGGLYIYVSIFIDFNVILY